jgi:hypothetical protein
MWLRGEAAAMCEFLRRAQVAATADTPRSGGAVYALYAGPYSHGFFRKGYPGALTDQWAARPGQDDESVPNPSAVIQGQGGAGADMPESAALPA